MRETTNGRGGPTIQLKIGRLQAAAFERNWTSQREIAEGIGTTPPNLCRLLNDDPDERQLPGTQFIAALLLAFPEYPFEHFFEAVPAQPEAKAA